MRSDTIEAQTKYYELERIFEWHKWSAKIPAIQFPPHWRVRIVPPFAAAMIRFRISVEGSKYEISVYLDCHETLGCWDGQPYWEIYPAADGDTARFDMVDVKGLLEAITESLEEMK